MATAQSFRQALIVVLGIVTTLAPLAASSWDSIDRDDSVKLTRIGHPTWKPVDFHVFSAPIGTAGSGYAEFAATAQAVLPPPNHVFHPQLLIGPGAPHAPPYQLELDGGVAAAGFQDRVIFHEAQFSSGNGVYVVWMNIPNPGSKGSSPDFASGRIVPNSLFPIHVAGTAFQNGALYDPFIGTFDLPALNDPSLTPSFDVEGASHFPIFFADNSDFGPPGASVRGRYTYDVVLTDQTGNGWHIEARFLVVP
jgi:hypothetical protein